MGDRRRQLVKVPSAGSPLPVRLGARADRDRRARGPVQARVSERTALGTYYTLLVVAVGLGVTAVYQSERYADLARRADLAAAKSAQLAARVEEIEHRDERLLGLALDALGGDAKAILEELHSLQESHPRLASAPSFSHLLSAARDLDERDRRFETASGALGPAAPQPEAALPPAEPQVARLPEVSISATEDSWIQVVDGASRSAIFTRTLKPGESYSVTPTPGTVLITGNAGGLVLSVDGVAAPPLAPKPYGRREIALDPPRLLDGTAERGKASNM